MIPPLYHLTLEEIKECLQLIDEPRNSCIDERTWESVTNWLLGKEPFMAHHDFPTTAEFMAWMRY